MLRILHTSDWHIGQVLYGYDRSDDHRHALRRIAAIAAEERPDAILVSGDIFHTSNPSAASQQLFADALDTLRTAVPDTPVIITAGNHDGPSRLEAFAPLFRRLDITVVGQPPRVGEADSYLRDILVELPAGRILPLPFMLPQRYDDTLADAIGRLADSFTDSLPFVIAAHATIAPDAAGAEAVGGIEAIRPDAICSARADYVALGHIHRPQQIPSDGSCLRYCGSPLAVSFDETYEHSVSIVSIPERGGKPTVDTLPVEPLHPLVTIGGDEGTDWDEAQRRLAEFAASGPVPGTYVRLNIALQPGDKLPPDADMTAARAVADAGCRFCILNAILGRREIADTSTSMSIPEFRALKPAELARRYAERRGTTLSEHIWQLFDEALADATPTQP